MLKITSLRDVIHQFGGTNHTQTTQPSPAPTPSTVDRFFDSYATLSSHSSKGTISAVLAAAANLPTDHCDEAAALFPSTHSSPAVSLPEKETASTHIARAHDQIADHNYHQAITALRTALTYDPNNIFAKLDLADTLIGCSYSPKVRQTNKGKNLEHKKNPFRTPKHSIEGAIEEAVDHIQDVIVTLEQNLGSPNNALYCSRAYTLLAIVCYDHDFLHRSKGKQSKKGKANLNLARTYLEKARAYWKEVDQEVKKDHTKLFGMMVFHERRMYK